MRKPIKARARMNKAARTPRPALRPFVDGAFGAVVGKQLRVMLSVFEWQLYSPVALSCSKAGRVAEAEEVVLGLLVLAGVAADVEPPDEPVESSTKLEAGEIGGWEPAVVGTMSVLAGKVAYLTKAAGNVLEGIDIVARVTPVLTAMS